MNFKTKPNKVKLGPHEITFSWSAMKIPKYISTNQIFKQLLISRYIAKHDQV
jgi:hypothetical protein